MRFEEKCPCGGEIIVIYQAHAWEGVDSVRREQVTAQKQIDVFRRTHKPCVKNPQEAVRDA